jgi:hypothetical protein
MNHDKWMNKIGDVELGGGSIEQPHKSFYFILPGLSEIVYSKEE